LGQNKIYIEDNSTVNRVIAIISKGEDCSYLSTETFKQKYIEVTGDKHTEEKKGASNKEKDREASENLLVASMDRGVKTWAHLYLLNFSKTLKKTNSESLESFLKDNEYTMDERGYAQFEDVEKLFRKLDPAISIDDLKKLSKEIKHSKLEKYDINALD
jgi:hypothetical protein